MPGRSECAKACLYCRQRPSPSLAWVPKYRVRLRHRIACMNERLDLTAGDK